MMTLQTLGGVRILDQSGQPVTLRSRKHTGLLLLLAGGGRRVHARSRLCELFWTTSESRARHSLSQAIYDLNQRLGPIVVRGTGEDLSLNAARVDYDVHRFESAVKKNDLETAVEVYQGPFGDNLVAAGTAEFERWLDSERTRLSRLGEVILRRFVEECETRAQWGPMCIAALKLISLTPLDEGVHRTYMRALWLHGDGASALRHYQSLVEGGENAPTRISEEMTELVRRIESRPRAEAPATRTIDREPPFVGRESEFKALRGTVERIHDTDTTAIVVSGEAGIGKSRLVKEFYRSIQVEPLRILSSRCYQAEEDIPYTPIVDALAPVVSELLLEQPEIRSRFRRLAYLLPDFGSRDAQEVDRETIDPSAWKRQVYEDVASFVAMVTERDPVVWIVDDVQWIDRASAGLLHYLSRRLSGRPFLLVITVRNGRETDELPAIPVATPESGNGATRSVPLRPLSEEQIAEIVQHARPEGAQHPASELAVRLSAGNPYYALEVLEAAAKSSEWAKGASDWDPLNDDRLRKVLDIRISGLGADRIRLLQAIGVLERYARPRLVAGVAGVDLAEAAQLASELYQRSLIVDEEDRIAFTNDAMREFVYSEMTAIERAALHLSAGHALEAESDATPGALATHFFHGDEWSRAFGYAMEAARSAQRSAGHSEAAHFAGIAARIAPGEDERRAALETRAESLFAAGELAEAAACYEGIIKIELLTPTDRARAYLCAAEVELTRCRWLTARKRLTQGRTAIDPIPDDDRRLAMSATHAELTLKLAFLSDDTAAALAASQRIDELVRTLRKTQSVSRRTEFSVLSTKAIQEAVTGSSQRALVLMGEAESCLGDAEPDQRLRYYSFRGYIRSRLASWEPAEADLKRGLAIAQATGNLTETIRLWNNLACIATERGQWASSLERIEKARLLHGSYAERTDTTLSLALNTANSLFYQGFLARASEQYLQAGRICEIDSIKGAQLEVHSCLGLIALQRREAPSAVHHWHQIQRLQREAGITEGTQERFKLDWFSAWMSEDYFRLGRAAATEEDRDFASFLKLRCLHTLMSDADPTELTNIKELLARYDMSWFVAFASRWLRSASPAASVGL